MEDRITELETRLSYQDRLIQELNEVVTRQQDQIDRLTRDLERLFRQMQGQQSGLARPDEEAPPPHY